MAETPDKHEDPSASLIEAIKNQPDIIDRLAQPGHSKKRHLGPSPADTMDRVLKRIHPETLESRLANPNRKNKLNVSSAFASKQQYTDTITAAILENIDRISNWLQSEATSQLDLPPFKTENAAIGFGFRFDAKSGVPRLYEYESKTCHITLQKGARSDEQTGPYTLDNIYIQTAYPVIIDGYQIDVTPTPDLRPVVKTTDTYESADAITQAWFDHIANNPQLSVIPTQDKHLKIYLCQQAERNIIRIGQNEQDYTVMPDGTQPTQLIKDIQKEGNFPENRLVFIIEGPVRNVIEAAHPDELAQADALLQNIQDKLKTKTGPKKGLKRSLPKKQSSNDNDTKRQTSEPKIQESQEAQDPEPTPVPVPMPQATYSALSQKQAIQQQTAGLLNRGDSSVRRFLQESERLNALQEEQQKKPKNNKYDE